MPYKLAIANIVNVPMKFSMKDGGTIRQFAFSLQCRRILAAEWFEGVRDENGRVVDTKVKSLMMDLTTGWKDQTLVNDEDGQPAEFCQEALDVMFDTPGLLDLAVTKYLAEGQAKAKN